MPEIEKSERREARRRRERYGQRGQAKWWHAVARSQARRARILEERASLPHHPIPKSEATGED